LFKIKTMNLEEFKRKVENMEHAMKLVEEGNEFTDKYKLLRDCLPVLEFIKLGVVHENWQEVVVARPQSIKRIDQTDKTEITLIVDRQFSEMKCILNSGNLVKLSTSNNF